MQNVHEAPNNRKLRRHNHRLLQETPSLEVLRRQNRVLREENAILEQIDAVLRQFAKQLEQLREGA